MINPDAPEGKEMEDSSNDQDLKRLEAEIESAVNRFFVERTAGFSEVSSGEDRTSPEKRIDTARNDTSLSVGEWAPSTAKDPIENLEAELLSLEWEITPEGIRKAKDQTVALQNALSEDPDTRSVLGFIEQVLTRMEKDEQVIRPDVITFLLDCKNTLRLLLSADTNEEVRIYRHLAYAGIEARFSCLRVCEEPKTAEALPIQEQPNESGGILGLQDRMHLLAEKIDALSEKIDRSLGARDVIPVAQALPVDITIFKIGEKLFGVPSEKVFKLYRVPSHAISRYSDQETIRTKDMELKIIDASKHLAAERGMVRGEGKLLTLREDEEYKGMLIDGVVKTVSVAVEPGGQGRSFSGIVHWTYERNPVTVPVLNVKEL
jgi:hypothetical protein